MFDLLIKNGRVFDGAGNPWFRADLGIAGDRIAAVGQLGDAEAKRILDVSGQFVAPGFVDAHGHSELVAVTDPQLAPKVMQGVTSEVCGNCGLSVAPVSDATREGVKQRIGSTLGGPGMVWDWSSVGEFLDRLDRGLGTNLAYLAPHAALRIQVMGYEPRAATGEEIARMQKLLRRALEEGAVGLSTGLNFSPACYSTEEEIAALCDILREYGAVHASHMRDYLDDVDSGIAEIVSIGRKTGAASHIAHFAAVGKNKGRSDRMLARIDAARADQVDLTVDAYPYIAGSTNLHEMLPAWVHEGGMAEMAVRVADPEVRRRLEQEVGHPELVGWEDILIVFIENPEMKQYEMKRVSEIAEDRGTSSVEAVCDLLVEDNLRPRIVTFIGNESDVQNIMRHPAHMFSTDALIYGDHVHPRSYGTYPRILGRYVREMGNLSWEEAIRKMTSFPARRFGLRGRGQISEGFYADLVVFAPERILDTATFEHSNRFPEGIAAVIVNGAPVVENGSLTGERSGRVLRRA